MMLNGIECEKIVWPTKCSQGTTERHLPLVLRQRKNVSNYSVLYKNPSRICFFFANSVKETGVIGLLPTMSPVMRQPQTETLLAFPPGKTLPAYTGSTPSA